MEIDSKDEFLALEILHKTTNMNYKKPFYQVPNIIYGNGSIKRLNELIPSKKNKILIVIDSILNFDKENLLDKSYNYSVYEYDATKMNHILKK